MKISTLSEHNYNFLSYWVCGRATRVNGGRSGQLCWQNLSMSWLWTSKVSNFGITSACFFEHGTNWIVKPKLPFKPEFNNPTWPLLFPWKLNEVSFGLYLVFSHNPLFSYNLLIRFLNIITIFCPIGSAADQQGLMGGGAVKYADKTWARAGFDQKPTNYMRREGYGKTPNKGKTLLHSIFMEITRARSYC